jgi:DNA-directed RNA polymerase subunit RPC12/RpoP
MSTNLNTDKVVYYKCGTCGTKFGEFPNATVVNEHFKTCTAYLGSDAVKKERPLVFYQADRGSEQ